MRRNINNKRRLYESIMKDVSKIVKKHLNENSNNEIMPITLLKKAILKYKRAELLGDVRVRNLKNKIEYVYGFRFYKQEDWNNAFKKYL